MILKSQCSDSSDEVPRDENGGQDSGRPGRINKQVLVSMSH
jgi:hypothetical protein